MAEPTCRICYASTLTPDEREHFWAEPITTTVFMCPKHQKRHDKMLRSIDHKAWVVSGTMTGRF